MKKRKKLKPVIAWAAVRYGCIEPHMVFSMLKLANGWSDYVVRVEIREAPKRKRAKKGAKR